MLKTHFVGDFAGATSNTCARTRNYTQRRATTTNPDKVTCARCKKIFAHEIEKRRAELRGEYVENGIEYARCPICSETCSTHDDAANPLTLCGDCGEKCCSKCCDETSATRCTRCQAASAKIARQIRAERGEQLTQEERDAEISELLDEERTLRTLVQQREQLTSTHKQNAFKNGRVHRSALKAYYASKDLLSIEVTKLNAVRAQLCVPDALSACTRRARATSASSLSDSNRQEIQQMLMIYAQAAHDARSRPSDLVLASGERLQFIGTRATKASAQQLARRASQRVNGIALVQSRGVLPEFRVTYLRGKRNG